MHTTPANYKLMDLIDDARQGTLVLPQFQRNFVWSRDDITELLKSIFQGYFIGSLLLLNTDNESIPFAIRAIEGVKLSPEDLHPNLMILDGQQRLTALNYAFTGPDIPLRWTKYPYRFFLELEKVTQGDWEAAISSYRLAECHELSDPLYQFTHKVFPLTEIYRWDDWINQYDQWLAKQNSEFFLHDHLPHIRLIWYDLINGVRYYQVPTITLPKMKPDDPKALAEVCTIFEKINTTGVKLSVYDLLTARLYKFKIDLHKLWQSAMDDHPILREYSEGVPDEFGVYILRIIALMRGIDTKSRLLINLSPVKFKEDWERAVNFAEKALDRMTSIGTDGFGAFDRKWMPYITMVSPLAAMLATIEEKQMDHKAYHLLQRWYWSSVFSERYAGSVESSISRDYRDFLQAMQDEAHEGEAIRDARLRIIDNPNFSLSDIYRLNSIYRSIICLIALRGAKDFAANDAIHFHTLEDHHIFPDAFLSKRTSPDGKKYPKDQINCILNRTLISDRTNRRISRTAPSKYIKTVLPPALVETILNSHYIPADGQRAMAVDDFEAFQSAREKALLHEIRQRIHG